MALFNSFRKKRKFYLLIFAIILIFTFSSSAVSFPKLSLINIIKFPLYVARFFIHEIKALVSYRINLSENTKLRQENDDLRQKLVTYREIVYENERLKNLLFFKKQFKFSLIPARMIGRDSVNWANSIIIDKGENEGVSVGELVITDLGLVGKTFEVSKNTSRVMLITDPNFNISGIIQRSRETGIVSGSLLGKCVMRYLTVDADIKVGDIVLTLGLDEGSPKGITIGEIVSWHSEQDGITYSAIIRPKVRLATIEEVFVIK